VLFRESRSAARASRFSRAVLSFRPLALLTVLALPAAGAPRAPARAPELPSQDPRQWIGPPTRLADLRGSVVLLDVWTFG
jgi:hypothetical protein